MHELLLGGKSSHMEATRHASLHKRNSAVSTNSSQVCGNITDKEFKSKRKYAFHHNGNVFLF